jgi:NAD(P)-dependent dehydrogenase (short-subunit alcohol dehydrogenase family)
VLDGRVAIVTGAGAGLGRSHARFLAEQGAAVLVNDIGAAKDGRGSSNAAEEVAAEIRAAGGRAVANTGSVAERAAAEAMVAQAVDELGGVDVVVANAGIVRDGLYEDYTDDDLHALLDVHLLGSFFVTQAAYRVMKAQRYGRVVFTTSGSGLYGQPMSPGYVAAKMGVVGLMNSLAVEGRDHGVLANAIAPIAYTRMTAAAFGPEMERQTRPELVSALVAHLASEACTVTKEIFEIGAGTYSRVFVGRTAGVALDPMDDVTPEAVAEHLDEIRDTAGFTTPDDVMAMLSDVLATRFEYGGAQHRDTSEPG